MSRIGNAPITLPEGVEINVSSDNIVSVKGKLGELSEKVHQDIKVDIKEGVVTLSRPNDMKENRSMHGLYRALINNMVEGVSKGFVKEQELVGVGYRAKSQGQRLELSLGFSHPIIFELPAEVKVTAVTEKGKNPTIKLESHDKQLIGQVAAKIRSFRKPEPYKGKGILFKGEVIRRKAGKTAAK
ncbi:MAG: 50S ribosomal protein L6 [Crocinitomicaceae bacterium]|nr:50S ribosomal protein L6 [Crocinitomicaceae bacterium]|tara:strand:+ start:713 stop:1267 length:555 start_codon:yes stop_codon:yes gene_type:complete